MRGIRPDTVGLITALDKLGVFSNARIRAAFGTVPRAMFLPNIAADEVYTDRAIITKRDTTGAAISSSSQPTMMAQMLTQLDLQPGMNVLEIGAGTGYNAAIMQALVGSEGRVTSIELDVDVANQARDNLQRAGYGSVHVVEADGAAGYSPRAAYDRIICTATALGVPAAWVRQLKQDRLHRPPQLRDQHGPAGGPERAPAYGRIPHGNHSVRGRPEPPRRLRTILGKTGRARGNKKRFRPPGRGHRPQRGRQRDRGRSLARRARNGNIQRRRRVDQRTFNGVSSVRQRGLAANRDALGPLDHPRVRSERLVLGAFEHRHVLLGDADALGKLLRAHLALGQHDIEIDEDGHRVPHTIWRWASARRWASDMT